MRGGGLLLCRRPLVLHVEASYESPGEVYYPY